MVRTTLTEPKTALAGVMLEISFARLMASMATFNDERAPSRRRWVFGSIVEAQGSREEAVRHAGCEERPEPKMEMGGLFFS